MTALFLLRLANLLIWSGLLIYMIPGAFHAVTGNDVRRGDPMRLGVGWVCVVMIAGNLRWLFAPENENLLASVHVLAALVGLYIIRLANAYGRGPIL